jgi:hypothetical protein
MAPSWSFAVARDDLSRTALLDGVDGEVGAGEALLRVDKVGVTANNVTYAVLGKAFRYWDFFPTEPGWGLVPLWGFADVVASAAAGVEVGARVYGYLPPASHLLVRPDRVDARGFRDASPHRAPLPSLYNTYSLTTGDPGYQARWEDLQILYRPLFFTSFILADQLADSGFFGAEVIVLSSASSKTAYGTAYLLHGTGPRVVGLTAPGNVAFTESLGCYDTVLPYDAIPELDVTAPTAYLDFAGNADVSTLVRQHLDARLVHDLVIGRTHHDQASGQASTGPRPTVFFAPDQIRKRTADWGREGVDQRFGAAWQRFAPAVQSWVDVTTQHGPEALRDVWLEVQAGHSPPRVGHVLTF